MSQSVLAYHFVGATLRDGQPIPPNNEWLEHKGRIEMCYSGLHASVCPFDALQYAPGATLCRVELDGEIISQTDKIVGRRRKILKRIDATQLLRLFARQCALDVVHLWESPDVVKQYLETGEESLRAAVGDAAGAVWDAARNAARAAAWDAAVAAARVAAYAASAAARDAAGAAASAAARAAQRARFVTLVEDAFAE